MIDKTTNQYNTNHSNKPQYKYIREKTRRIAREICN